MSFEDFLQEQDDKVKREISEKEKGLINDEEYEQVKKEILEK